MNDQPVFNIPQTIKEDTEKYETEVERFLTGELDAVRFKGYRVPMGVYGQRAETEGEERYMIRVRAPGGVITKKQLEVLNELGREYGGGYLHFTTRQDVQIHQVGIEDTPEILYKLLEVGLSPRGGGGNTVRNIMNSSRAGVNPDEVFDTTPHNLALTEYLIRSRSSFNLPRKYKIAFSVTEEDEALATINDLGFIAQEKDGKRGFKVYAAGGMGNQPQVALLLEEFITEDRIFYVAEAIKRFFDDYGDWSDKNKARLRFVRKKLGDQEFVARYREYLAEVIEEGIDTEELTYYQEPRSKPSEGSRDLTPDYIYPEKVSGYYSLELRPAKGDIKYQDLAAVLELLTDEEISLRTTNRQGFLIRGVKAETVEQLISSINEINSDFLVKNKGTMPIACKGASTCRLGLCLSPGLAAQIRQTLLELEDELQSVIPQIYISGCPNCCGQHLIGKIGFEGRAKRFNDKLVPHYALLVGGNVAEGETKYGERVIDIPAKRIPSLLVELAEVLAEDGEYNKERIVELAAEYTAVPDYEQAPEIYRDWGAEEDFSLAGRGPGECGTGVMDIIQLDLDTAKNNYQTAVENGDDEQLYEAIVNAARALLVVRGVDTEKDREILSAFKSEFIDQKLVDEAKAELLNIAIDYKLGDIDNLQDYSQKIKGLIGEVEKLFGSLNAKLEFDLDENDKLNNESQQQKELDLDKEESGDIEVVDLRGVECPMNFVKAKVAMAPLDKGEVLEIYLDQGKPIANVPDSLASEGHEILAQQKTEEGHYVLKVKKN